MTQKPDGTPMKADDHGMTGEQARRAQAEEHKAALDAIRRHHAERCWKSRCAARWRLRISSGKPPRWSRRCRS